MKMKLSSSIVAAISIVSTDAAKVRRLRIGEDTIPVGSGLAGPGPGPGPRPEGDRIPDLSDYVDASQEFNSSMSASTLPPVVVVSELKPKAEKDQGVEVLAAPINEDVVRNPVPFAQAGSMHAVVDDPMSKSGKPPGPTVPATASADKGSSGPMNSHSVEAKAEKTYADHYDGSMPEVDAKAQKATFGSYAFGPTPKSGKAALTKSSKTFATTGSMREVDAKAEKFLAGSTPPYHVFAKEKAPKSGKATVGSEVTYSLGAEEIPIDSTPAHTHGSMRFVDDSKAHKIASSMSMMFTVAADEDTGELHEGEKGDILDRVPVTPASEDIVDRVPIGPSTETVTTAVPEEPTTTTEATTTTITTAIATTLPCDSVECMDCPAVLTAPDLDGGTFDWLDVEPYATPMHYAQDGTQVYPHGNLVIKCVHDNQSVYFLFEVPGPFRCEQDNNKKCAAISTMFRMGEDAEYYNMGNCPAAETSCAADPSQCTNYKIDVGGHWEIGRSNMGVKYGEGNIRDEYAYGPNCYVVDEDAGMEWEGAWIHTSPMEGNDGTWIFEMSRLLKTNSSDDTQLDVGGAADFGFAYWDPYESSNGWTLEGRYVTGETVNWINLRLLA